MKDLVYYGYIGTCEPDGRGGFRGHLVGLSGPTPTYRSASPEALKEAHQKAAMEYYEACTAAGRLPAIPPEPFHLASHRDVAWMRDLREEGEAQLVRVLAYYSLQEVFLRGRDQNQTARTMAAWCLLGRWSYGDNLNVAEKVAAKLDQYGWNPCPGWDYENKLGR